jgi:hypothetical protein
MADSGNVCRIKKLGDGGVFLDWRNKPSEADKTESEEWIQTRLAEALDITRHEDQETAKQAHAEWLREHR